MAALLSMPGCGLTGFEDSHRLDPEDIQALIDSAPYPDITPRALAIQPERITTKPDGTRSIKINLVEALRLSLVNNQGFLSTTEALDLQLLSLEVLRRSWWPLQSPLVASASWADAKDSDPSSSQSISAGISQKLPYGGSATLSFSEAGSQGTGPNVYSSAVTAGVNIPLLRGGGWRTAVESKVAAERGYVYSRRTYEFARTSLLIQTVQSFFGQIQQQVSIGNLERTLESARKGVERSTLMFGAGKVTRSDVFREELNVANAENSLTRAREDLRLSLDAFKIDLGLRPEDELILEKETIEFKSLTVDTKEAVEAALATNPRWLNARDQFDDAGRALEIASNATLPQVDVSGSYSWLQQPESRPFEEFETGSRAVALGASFSIDLDRSAVNRDYQGAVVSYRQAQRSFQRARDELTRETQRLLIQLRQAEISMNIQDRARKDAKKALELAEDEYDR
ncbi:MAG TPA: TolC family protein, partial [Planctomycetota bacterium]|nr:TolC family protein [Planctomycetota bacterium]